MNRYSGLAWRSWRPLTLDRCRNFKQRLGPIDCRKLAILDQADGADGRVHCQLSISHRGAIFHGLPRRPGNYARYYPLIGKLVVSMPILRAQACVSAVWPSPTVGRPGSQPASTSSTGPKNQEPKTRNQKPENRNQQEKKKERKKKKPSPHPLVSVLPSSDQSSSESHHTY